MTKRWHLTLAALAATFACSTAASAAVLVNDTWLDSDRSLPAAPTYSEAGVDSDADGNLESAWYSSNSAGMTAAPGHLNQVSAAGSTSFTTYYTAESSPVTLANTGDSLEVRWVFTPAGVANDATTNTGQNFRLAVVNSPSASRVSTNAAPGGAPSAADNYFGYAMFMNMDQTLRRSTPFQLMERTSGIAAILGTGADWVGIGNNGTTGNPGYASGTSYTYTMTLTRNAASGLDIVSRMAGAGLGPSGQGFLEVALTDATPSGFSYDTFSVRPSAAATSAASFDTSLFKVTFTPGVPEPASLALAGFGGLAALAFRRRR